MTLSGTGRMNFCQNMIVVSRDIKLWHTVFALPFAILATFLAAGYGGHRPSVVEVLLIVVCMFFARTAAMTINRWADAKFDGANPRTRGRAIPSGQMSSGTMLGFVIGSGLLFVLTTLLFYFVLDNPYPFYLSPGVLFYLCFYSYFKRFTFLCHLFLGSALALSPLAATLAINPAYLGRIEPYLIGLMVLSWVAGFDIIYALQDVEIDKAAGLHSMPSRLGVGTALNISRGLHATVPLWLGYLVYCSPMLNLGFTVGVVLVGALLFFEHYLIYKSKTKHMHLAFFTLNGIISLLLGILGIIDIYLA